MRGSILAQRVALPEGAELAMQTGTVVQDPRLAEPQRPGAVSAGAWRRMTRLARLLTVQVLELKQAYPQLDWPSLPLVWGSALGEVVPSTMFLDRILAPGGGLGSPTAFQNSVYNSTPGHVSMLLGMQGGAETVCVGQATGLAALYRGLSLLRDHAHVLVCVGEDRGQAAERSWSFADGPVGEAVVSVLLTRGQNIEVTWGAGATVAPVVGRQTPMFWEAAPLPAADVVPERVCGHCSAAGLATWLSLGEGSLVEVDGLTALRARLH